MSFLNIRFLKNNKILSIRTELHTAMKTFYLNNRIFESLDNIYEISITDDLIIVTTDAPEFRNGESSAPVHSEPRKEKNNITAYDWNGTPVWNISDIIKDMDMVFWGGQVVTHDILQDKSIQFDCDCPPTHELFTCSAGGYLFVIDLNTRKVIGTSYNRR